MYIALAQTLYGIHKKLVILMSFLTFLPLLINSMDHNAKLTSHNTLSSTSLNALRVMLTDILPEYITAVAPSISAIEYPLPKQRYGVCHNYALAKKLNILGKMNQILPIAGLEDWYTEYHFLEDYCQEVKTPQKGDIVIYKKSISDATICHTGLVYDDGLVESKWGKEKIIYVHPTLHLPHIHGNDVRYYKTIKTNAEIINDMRIKCDLNIRRKQESTIAHEFLLNANKNNPLIATLPRCVIAHEIAILLDLHMYTNIDVTNQLGQTPLILSTCSGYANLVLLYIEYGANINHQDTLGNTALHYAAIHDNRSIIQCLLQSGCKTDLPNKAGQRAEYFCTHKTYDAVFKLYKNLLFKDSLFEQN